MEFSLTEFPRVLWSQVDKPIIPSKGYFFAHHTRVRAEFRPMLNHRGSVCFGLYKKDSLFSWDEFYMIGYHELQFISLSSFLDPLGAVSDAVSAFKVWIKAQTYYIEAGTEYYDDDDFDLGDMPAGAVRLVFRTAVASDLFSVNFGPYIKNHTFEGETKRVLSGGKVLKLTQEEDEPNELAQQQAHQTFPNVDDTLVIESFLENSIMNTATKLKMLKKENTILFVDNPPIPVISEVTLSGGKKAALSRYNELEKMYLSLVGASNSMYKDLLSQTDFLEQEQTKVKKEFAEFKKNAIEFGDLQGLMRAVSKQAGFTLPRMVAGMNGKDILHLFMTEVMVRMKGIGPDLDEVP